MIRNTLLQPFSYTKYKANIQSRIQYNSVYTRSLSSRVLPQYINLKCGYVVPSKMIVSNYMFTAIKSISISFSSPVNIDSAKTLEHFRFIFMIGFVMLHVKKKADPLTALF